jgi:hypothetical protein
VDSPVRVIIVHTQEDWGLSLKLSESACYDGHFLTEHAAASLLVSKTLFLVITHK